MKKAFRSILFADSFNGDKIDLKGVTFPKESLPVYDHTREGKTVVGTIKSASLKITNDGYLDILTGEIELHPGVQNLIWLPGITKMEPYGKVIECHNVSTKKWYNPLTWRNKPIKIIDKIDLIGVSIQ